MKAHKKSSNINAKNVNYSLIKDYIKQNYLTVEEFLAICGISSSTFYRIISGKNNVSRKNIFRIAFAMKIEPIDLIRSDLE